MKLRLKIKDKEYKIEIERVNGKDTKIKVGKEEFLFSDRKKEELREVAKTSFPKKDFRDKELRAPIAGTVSEVFVKENELVRKGQKVVLLSAMKMENEIISDFEGKVKKVLVKKNEKVKEKDVLVILD